MKETKRMSAAQRRARQRKLRNRRIAMTVALVLVVALASIGGTIAWLTDTTNEVTNTFTVGDINIELTETPNADSDDQDTENDHWEAKLVPGSTYAKDPKVTVKANSEKCWLFVEVTEENNPQSYLSYTYTFDANNTDPATGWVKGDVTNVPANVWYRIVDTRDTDQTWNLITDNQVTVKDTVVKKGTNTAGTSNVAMPANDADAPKITFKAYACQYENRTNVADAWAAVQPTP